MVVDKSFSFSVSSSTPTIRGHVNIAHSIADTYSNHISIFASCGVVAIMETKVVEALIFDIKYVYGMEFYEKLRPTFLEYQNYFLDCFKENEASVEKMKKQIALFKSFVQEYQNLSNYKKVPPIDENINTLFGIFAYRLEMLNKYQYL